MYLLLQTQEKVPTQSVLGCQVLRIQDTGRGWGRNRQQKSARSQVRFVSGSVSPQSAIGEQQGARYDKRIVAGAGVLWRYVPEGGRERERTEADEGSGGGVGWVLTGPSTPAARD